VVEDLDPEFLLLVARDLELHHELVLGLVDVRCGRKSRREADLLEDPPHPTLHRVELL
jgi:hypothetical protein